MAVTEVNGFPNQPRPATPFGAHFDFPNPRFATPATPCPAPKIRKQTAPELVSIGAGGGFAARFYSQN